MIRLANKNDLNAIMMIIRETQKEMQAQHNPQWSIENDYPNKNKFLTDIANNDLYVYENDQNLKGFITITKDTGEYNELLPTSNEPAYILHRLAIKKENRKEGLASLLFKYAEELALKNNIKILKADTETHNIKMNNLFIKLGFIQKGEFEYSDYPGHYIYYEKEIKSSPSEK